MKRSTVSRIQIGSKDQLVISAAGDRLDLRPHEDITGSGAYMATARGFAIPRERIGELIEALQEEECRCEVCD